MLIKPNAGQPAKIKVVGIGGGGGNALATMIAQEDIKGVEFSQPVLGTIPASSVRQGQLEMQDAAARAYSRISSRPHL